MGPIIFLLLPVKKIRKKIFFFSFSEGGGSLFSAKFSSSTCQNIRRNKKNIRLLLLFRGVFIFAKFSSSSIQKRRKNLKNILLLLLSGGILIFKYIFVFFLSKKKNILLLLLWGFSIFIESFFFFLTKNKKR